MKYIYSSKDPAIYICKKGKKIPLLYNIGIVSAFLPEQDMIIGGATKIFPPINGVSRKFNRFIFEGHLVVAVLCGVGMTNSSLTTQNLIDIFNPTYLLFSGIAGNMNDKHNVGDVIINRRWVDFSMTKYIRTNTPYNDFYDNEPDYPTTMFRPIDNKVISLTWPTLDGTTDPVPPTNNIIDGKLLKTKQMSIPIYTETLVGPNDAYLSVVPSRFFFDADKYLLRIARRAIKKGIVLNDIQTYTPTVSIGDVGLSSNVFVDNAEWRMDVHRQFIVGGYVVETTDMETAAFAQTAISNKKPFLAIRALSDLAGAGTNPEHINVFFEVAASNSLIVFRSLLMMLATEKKYCHKHH